MADTPVSIREVAALAGVSVGTVSNVLNRPEVVAEPTRTRVQAAIKQLGFIRNESARQLRAGRSRTIGLVVLDVANPFFTDVARGVEDEASEAGLAVILCNSDDQKAKESRYLEVLEEHRVQGILITPVAGADARLARVQRRGTPVVLVDSRSPSRGQCSVSVDDVLGGDLAVSHLLEAGHERIAFVGGPLSIRQVSDRREGAVRALERAGRAPGDLHVAETPALNVSAGQKAAAMLADLPPEIRPTAVFCANDLLALGVLQELTSRRIRVPDGIAIVGYDDVDFAAAAAVPLSSVRQPRHQLGRAAAQLLIEEALGDGTHRHRQVVFEPDLVVRASSQGRARRSRKVRAAPEPASAGGRQRGRGQWHGRITRMRIALFVTCLADTLFPDAGQATVALLERLGHQVEFPAAQTCCGQMHVNTGYQREALPLVRRYVGRLRRVRGDRGRRPARAPGRSGTSTRWWPGGYGDEALAAAGRGGRGPHLRAVRAAGRRAGGARTSGAYYPHRVTYHPTCHSLRMLRVGDRPLRLLRQVRGIDLVELPDADVCCGFGGTFAVKNADVSTAMLADKMRNVLPPGAEVCTAGDSSCLMHIGGGLSRLRAGRPDRAPGRDPGLDRAAPAAAVPGDRPGRHVPGHADRPARGGPPARRRAVPGGGAPRAGRQPAAPQPGQGHRTIRAKRAAVVAELPDWEELRDAGQAIKAGTMAHLDRYLEQLEREVTARGGVVHWARDADEANADRRPAWSRRLGLPRSSRSSRS